MINEKLIQDIADKYGLPFGNVEDIAELFLEDGRSRAEIKDYLQLEMLAAQEYGDAMYEAKTCQYLSDILEELNCFSDIFISDKALSAEEIAKLYEGAIV